MGNRWIGLLALGVGLYFLLPPLLARGFGPYRRRLEAADARGVPRWLTHLLYITVGGLMSATGVLALLGMWPPWKRDLPARVSEKTPPALGVESEVRVVLSTDQTAGSERLAIVVRLSTGATERIDAWARELDQSPDWVIGRLIERHRVVDRAEVAALEDGRGLPPADPEAARRSAVYQDRVYQLSVGQVEGLQALCDRYRLTPGQVVGLLAARDRPDDAVR
jgi:predicted transcriptional regulator